MAEKLMAGVDVLPRWDNNTLVNPMGQVGSREEFFTLLRRSDPRGILIGRLNMLTTGSDVAMAKRLVEPGTFEAVPAPCAAAG